MDASKSDVGGDFAQSVEQNVGFEEVSSTTPKEELDEISGDEDPHDIAKERRKYLWKISMEDDSSDEELGDARSVAYRRGRKFDLGTISRIILDPAEPARGQPEKKMKKADAGVRVGAQPSAEPARGQPEKKMKKADAGVRVGAQPSAEPEKTLETNVADPKKKRKTLADLAFTKAKQFWVTADVHKGRDPESYVIYSMRDFVLYIIFLTVTAIIAFGSLAYAYNYHANVLAEILTNTKYPTPLGYRKTFKEVHRIKDIWLFIHAVVIPLLYTSAPKSGDVELSEDPISKFTGLRILEENILIGAPQIRQVRVKSGTCSSAPMFKDVYASCYEAYHTEIQDTKDFGAPNRPEFQYQAPVGYDFEISGWISDYGQGGFSMNFTADRNFTVKSLEELENNDWIQIGTRAVFLDFTLYSANANLFCVVQLLFEVIPTGGVITRNHVHVMKLLRYVSPWDFFIAGCEIVFICFTIYFLMEECQQIKILKEDYLTNWWNILDFTIVLISLSTIGLGIARFIIVNTNLKDKVLTIHTENFACFEELERIQTAFNVTVSILTFIVWVKLVKFSALNRSVSLIISTFGCVKLELLSLVLMTITVVLGFSVLGNALFGSHVLQFKTLPDSFFTLFGLFLGGLYFYDDCRHASRFYAQIFFVTFIFFVLVIFLSAFVALIVYGFHKAMNEIDDVRERVYFGDVCSQLCLKLLTTLKRKRLAEKIRARQLSKLYTRDYDALLHVIRRHGYRGLDLGLLLKKHNVVAGQPITLETMSDLYNDLNSRNQLHMEVEEHDKIMEHVDRINKSIEFLDLTLSDIVTKVDILANKIVDRPRR